MLVRGCTAWKKCKFDRQQQEAWSKIVLLYASSDVSVCAGVQLAKMTPFRSAVVMAYTAVSITILSLLQLKGGVITYVIVSMRDSAQHTP